MKAFTDSETAPSRAVLVATIPAATERLVRAMLGEHLQPALPERTLQQIEPSSI